jgi:dTDP-4-amino-4,6-dideoxygalactose transaminase
VLRSGRLVQGEQVAGFEEEFAGLVAGHGCAAVNSGTSALHLGLLAAGIGTGDEVIVPSFTYAGSANAIVLAGARPVYVDIDEKTFCVDPASVRAAIGPRTAAIMVVHLFGQCADMDGLTAIADEAGVALIEDACQAHGALWRGRPAGSFGSFAAFSFYPTKNMTSGEGGMVVTADEQLLGRVRLLRNQGGLRQYAHEIVGFNNRMTEVAAAIGRVQLGRLADRNARRRAHAEFYNRTLTRVRVPHVDARAEHVFHQYSVIVPERIDRDRLRADLQAAGVGTGAYYPVPCHRLEPLKADIELPVTDAAAASVLALPIFPGLGRRDLMHVATTLDALLLRS